MHGGSSGVRADIWKSSANMIGPAGKWSSGTVCGRAECAVTSFNAQRRGSMRSDERNVYQRYFGAGSESGPFLDHRWNCGLGVDVLSVKRCPLSRPSNRRHRLQLAHTLHQDSLVDAYSRL